MGNQLFLPDSILNSFLENHFLLERKAYTLYNHLPNSAKSQNEWAKNEKE